MNCNICEHEITDQGEIPTYISITGWITAENEEEMKQYSINVCRDCFLNRNTDILDELEENAAEYV
jgi:hypothetical protein